MPVGLPVSRLINVSVSFPTSSVQFLNLAAALIVGQSDVIDTKQRVRSYSSLTAVGADFGTTDPEYLAAETFFAAKPTPASVLLGRWAQTATAGRLVGGALTQAQQALTNFTTVTTGALEIAVDAGSATTVTGINLSTAQNLSGVASLIQTALVAGELNCTVTWTGSQFVIKSDTTGAASKVTMPVAPGSGTDLSPLLGLTAAAGAYSVVGIAAESLLAAVTALDGLATSWYWLSTDACTSQQASDVEAVSAYVQASSNPHAYFTTVQDPNAPVADETSDVGSALQQALAAAEPARTGGQYSTTNPYAACGIIGRGCTINWLGSNTAINFMWQPEPGVAAETLVSGQADALDAKRYNYLANYANGAAVLENGVMFGPNFIDEVVGADWLANYVQANVFTFMAGIGTKVGQDDDGVHSIENNIVGSLEQGVANGLLGPGVWTGPPVGELATGDMLDTGYYVYAPPIALQDLTSRGLRKTPPIQIAAKLKGATNTANILLNLNR